MYLEIQNDIYRIESRTGEIYVHSIQVHSSGIGMSKRIRAGFIFYYKDADPRQDDHGLFRFVMVLTKTGCYFANLLTSANKLVSLLTKPKFSLAHSNPCGSSKRTTFANIAKKKRHFNYFSILFFIPLFTLLFIFFYSIYIYYVSNVSKTSKRLVNTGVSGANEIANMAFLQVSNSNFVSKL